jgi:hypothetical protein
VDAPSHADAGRPPLDEPGPTGSPDGVIADRRPQGDQPQAPEPLAWRVLLAYARPYRLTLVGGGLLSLPLARSAWPCR